MDRIVKKSYLANIVDNRKMSQSHCPKQIEHLWCQETGWDGVGRIVHVGSKVLRKISWNYYPVFELVRIGCSSLFVSFSDICELRFNVQLMYRILCFNIYFSAYLWSNLFWNTMVWSNKMAERNKFQLLHLNSFKTTQKENWDILIIKLL